MTNKLVDELKFQQSKIDECVFYKGKSIILIYVDDVVLVGPDDQEIDHIVETMAGAFKITDEGTLADYLGVNQSIRESNYPGSTLKSNPLTKDIEVIRQLSRRQRQQLVDLLVEIYNPQPQTTTNQGIPTETEGTSSPESTSGTPGLSRPGDAQLLAP